MDKKIILFTQYFEYTNNKNRQLELDICLKINSNNPNIDKIILLNEKIYKNNAINHLKIEQVNISKRLTYNDVFEYCEKYCDKNDIKILMNTDIILDYEDTKYLKFCDLNNKVFALLRYELVPTNNKDFFLFEDIKQAWIKDNKDCKTSQDVWIFNNITPNKIYDFHLGIRGCDNHIAFLLDKNKYIVSNPSKTIKIYHLHNNSLKSHEDKQRINKKVGSKWEYKYLLPTLNQFIENKKKLKIFDTQNILKNKDFFWQYPVITEKEFYNQNKTDPYFVGMPWATIIDKGYDTKNLYKLIIPFIINTKTYTCCQHVNFRNLINFWKLLGLNRVYASHKKKGEDIINGIQILPCPLYASNFENEERNKIFKNVDFLNKKRTILYSFIGAYNSKNYISNIRNRIFNLKNKDNCIIEKTNSWHYEKIIYSKMQNSNYKFEEDKLQREHYNKILLNSRYTLCPSGSGPNSIRLWESLACGSIPILLADTLDLPNHDLWNEAIIILKEKELDNITKILNNIDNNKEKKMRKNCLKIYNYFKKNYRNILM